uniref:Uncharacterized protein n=1 Tax=Cacopsylla melanoneura TaxID=428564 RepID=A0A8D9E6L4_9HEMI
MLLMQLSEFSESSDDSTILDESCLITSSTSNSDQNTNASHDQNESLSDVSPRVPTLNRTNTRDSDLQVLQQTNNEKLRSKSIRIFYQNIRGLKTKTQEFFLNLLSEDYDVIAIVESWLTPDINSSELFDSRYVVFRQDRDTIKTGKESGGGLIIGVEKSFSSFP